MEPQTDFQSRKCERMMEFQTRALVGESIEASERGDLDLHLAACAACRALQQDLARADAGLRTSFAAARVSSSFVARTLAALPAAPVTQAPSAANAPRVFAAASVRRSWAARLSMAAALAAAVLVVWAAASFNKKTPAPEARGPMTVVWGKLHDASGRSVTHLQTGAVYTVQADSIIPLSEASVVTMKEGAEFQVEVARETGEHGLKLKTGDLFAWGRPESDARPLRVSCSSFDTLLHAGDFFVAENGSGEAGSVVIVFKGQAQVTRDNQTLPLRAGQVFYVLGAADMVFAQTLELTDAVGRLHDDPGVQRKDLADLRDQYEKQIRGYQKELADLEGLLVKEQNPQKLAELRKRQQLVLSYRDEHQRKLKSFWREFPYEELKRGLHGHTEPSTWL